MDAIMLKVSPMDVGKVLPRLSYAQRKMRSGDR